MKAYLAFLLLAFLALQVHADDVPAAVYADPPADAKHPASSAVLHIPSGSSTINGLMYSPPGDDPHPTFVFCHGLPGNEKNLDLAQAVRRAGWNAVTFNYRGSWGSPGKFSFAQNIEDAKAVLAFLRSPDNAARFHVDTRRLVLAGHSMGGWVTAHAAAQDPQLAGVILISMGDMGRLALEAPDKVREGMADNMEALAGVTAESMTTDLRSHARAFATLPTAAGLAHLPLLALTSEDGLAPHTEALVNAIKAAGGTRVTLTHVTTDHAWNDHRIALESLVIRWLQALP